MNAPEYRFTFAPRELDLHHPPRVFHPHKRLLLGQATLAHQFGPFGRRALTVSRWPAKEPTGALGPQRIDLALEPCAGVVAGYYDYAPIARPASETTEWHVNFADAELFVGYGGSLFAQDEIQVAEHPHLASVREALLAEGVSTRTHDGDRPAPILVTNVERRLAIDTGPNAAAGRPVGIYGRRFADANAQQVLGATRVVVPPTTSNIIAMSAPEGGRGLYSAADVHDVLSTALTAFRAARAESAATGGRAVVHSGFWGCGAFGGNRELMVAVQALAAAAAGLDRIVFHAGEPPGIEQARRAIDRAAAWIAGLGPSCAWADAVDHVLALGCRWGTSDGN